MAVTPAQFLVLCPEFLSAPVALLQAELNQAYTMTPVGIWGVYQEQGAQLRAAQSLALSPFGRAMALVNKEGTTVYDARLDRLVRIVAAGGSVT